MKLGKPLLIVFFSFLLLAASAFISFSVLFPHNRKGSETVTVPDLTGKLFDESGTDSGIFDVRTEYKSDISVSPGTVISQSPAPGCRRKVIRDKTRCTLLLTIGTGEAALPVPDLRGLDYRAARRDLRSKGFTVITRFISGGDADTVISTFPEAGREICEGSCVTLTVGSGKNNANTEMPNLHGMTLTDANVRLFLLGLTVGEIEREYSDTVPAGCVISQSMPAGAFPAKQSPVDLVVSLGARYNFYSDNGLSEVIDEFQ